MSNILDKDSDVSILLKGILFISILSLVLNVSILIWLTPYPQVDTSSQVKEVSTSKLSEEVSIPKASDPAQEVWKEADRMAIEEANNPPSDEEMASRVKAAEDAIEATRQDSARRAKEAEERANEIIEIIKNRQ